MSLVLIRLKSQETRSNDQIWFTIPPQKKTPKGISCSFEFLLAFTFDMSGPSVPLESSRVSAKFRLTKTYQRKLWLWKEWRTCWCIMMPELDGEHNRQGFYFSSTAGIFVTDSVLVCSLCLSSLSFFFFCYWDLMSPAIEGLKNDQIGWR